MLTIYILIGSFLVSLCVVASMLAYKMFKVDKSLEVVSGHDVHKIVSFHTKSVLKKTSRESVKILRFLFVVISIKARPVLKRIKKILINQYNDFFDSVNGKDEIKEKGAASFFLKTVAQHKKEIKKIK